MANYRRHLVAIVLNWIVKRVSNFGIDQNFDFVEEFEIAQPPARQNFDYESQS